jgi:hypothetical protein
MRKKKVRAREGRVIISKLKNRHETLEMSTFSGSKSEKGVFKKTYLAYENKHKINVIMTSFY